MHYKAFYAGLLYGEYAMNEWPGAHTFPDGTYLLLTWPDRTIGWYQHLAGGFVPIGLDVVPNELRTMVLLMQ